MNMTYGKKTLAKNAILNILKQVCSIVIPLISFKYVSVILGADNYGAVNYAASIVSYFSLLAGLGVRGYAVRQGALVRDDDCKFGKFVNEVFSINIVSMVFSFLILAIVIIFSKQLYDYRVIIAILGINIFFSTIGVEWINNIFEDFKSITVRYIICQLLSIVFLFTFVRESKDVIQYAIVLNLGNIVSCVWNYVYVRKKYRVSVAFTNKLNLKAHLTPILVLFVGAISTTIYLSSDTTLIGLLIDDRAVGLYTVSANIYSTIKSLLNALSMVAIPQFSIMLANGKYDEANKILSKMIGIIIMLVIPCLTGTFLFGKEIILLISSSEYIETVLTLKILCSALPFACVACLLLNVVMISAHKENGMLIATATSALINIFLNIILIPQYGYVAAAITTLISEGIMMCFGIAYLRNILNLHIGWELLISICGAVWIVILTKLIAWNGIETMSNLFITMIFGGGGYCLVLFLWLRRKGYFGRKG